MTLKDARELRVGEKVKSKYTEYVYEVFMLNEYISPIKRNTIIYVLCKTESGEITKFSHKELVLLK